jgi:two-component system sensor histidine kinase DevS
MGVRSPLLAAYGSDFAWSLLEAAPDAMVIASADGEIVFVNDQAGTVFACEPGELIGLQVEGLLPEGLQAVHRAHRTRFRADPAPRRMGAGLLLRALRPDGSTFPTEIALSPLRLGGELLVVAAVRDVTERVEAEDHLHRVLVTLDSSDDAVFIFDADSLRYSYVNEGAVRLVGYSREELLTMTPLHLNPHAPESDYRAVVDELELGVGATPMRQWTLMRKDGVEVPVETTFQHAPIARDGGRWIIALSRDISARLTAERELLRSQDALHDAEQVMAIAGDRERIARDLHDTVIQRLFGAGLSLNATLNLVGEAARVRISETIDSLDETISELRMAIFSLQGSAATTTGGLRGRVLAVVNDASAGLGFEPRVQFDGPIDAIDSDIAEHLLAVMREALSNVTHHAQATHVRVAVEATDEIVLTVTDDGIGVPADVFGGRGLGNMARRAEDLGGTFEIKCQSSGGSCLRWCVPAHAVVRRATP